MVEKDLFGMNHFLQELIIKIFNNDSLFVPVLKGMNYSYTNNETLGQSIGVLEQSDKVQQFSNYPLAYAARSVTSHPIRAAASQDQNQGTFEKSHGAH